MRPKNSLIRDMTEKSTTFNSNHLFSLSPSLNQLVTHSLTQMPTSNKKNGKRKQKQSTMVFFHQKFSACIALKKPFCRNNGNSLGIYITLHTIKSRSLHNAVLFCFRKRDLHNVHHKYCASDMKCLNFA